LALLTSTVVGASTWDWARKRLSLLHEQRKCLTHVAAPDQIATSLELNSVMWDITARVERDAAEKPLGAPRYLQRYAAALQTAGVVNGPPDWSSPETLFLHERRTPGGESRLLVVRRGMMDLWSFSYVCLTATVVRPGSLLKLPVVDDQKDSVPSTRFVQGIGSHRASDRLRLFAGQPDASDPTHFTIRYDINGERGTIDGWLRDDGMVTFTVRDGPAKE
jgi:hypothetical protein